MVNNLTINRSGGVTLGNQNLTINGLLNLEAGNIVIGPNNLTISGYSPTRTNGHIDASNVYGTLIFTNTEPVILPASIFTGNVNNLTINGSGGFGLEVPFGGVGRSGFGREGGIESLEAYSRVKSLFLKTR